jgi:ornithine cyclodeaminase/alanine dehydrogenase-like protein (mu-crystallin family)
VLGIKGTNGGFHVKAGVLALGRRYFATKVNGNFSRNAERGLPLIQGAILLSDGDDGSPLAITDSGEITLLRTAAATALAAQYLARADARVATICGCGAQAPAQLRALARVRSLRQVLAFDSDRDRARTFAAAMGRELKIEVVAVDDLKAAVLQSAICVTCTPSRTPVLFRDFVAPGAFIAAVGADSAEKQELEPELLAAATVVTDVTEQCATIGDLHHALALGRLTPDHVHAELGEIVAGKKHGRRSDDEIIVFDSTGMALQDVAAAARVFERAEATSRGVAIELSA